MTTAYSRLEAPCEAIRLRTAYSHAVAEDDHRVARQAAADLRELPGSAAVRALARRIDVA